jgi:FtsZ-binding cell division protein ZapB
VLHILAGMALVGAAVWIYDELQGCSSRERTRWYAKREQVQRSIEWHREQITQHLGNAQQSYNFQVLVDMHFSCVKVADEAYKLLQDARISLDKMGEALIKTREQRDLLFAQKKAARSKAERDELEQEIASLQQLREQLFKDKNEIKKQRDEFFNRVKELNGKTHDLKTAINERTGFKGREWYQRLEARKVQKRLQQNC